MDFFIAQFRGSLTLLVLVACGGVETTDLAGYAADAMIVTVEAVRATEPKGPKTIRLELNQQAGSCAALGSRVTATAGGRTMQQRGGGGWVAAPRIGSGGRLDNRECAVAWFDLELADETQIDALDADATFVVKDDSRTVVFEVLRPLAARALTVDGAAPVRSGDSLQLRWSPAAELKTHQGLLVLRCGPDVHFNLEGSATESGVRFTVPTDAPVGPATVTVPELARLTRRCEGVPSCRWQQHWRNGVNELAFTIAP